MMSKEILHVADVLANEKGVPKDDVYGAIEEALASATCKTRQRSSMKVRVEIDRETGDYKTWRLWEVVENEEAVQNREIEIPQVQAQAKEADAQVGDTIEESIESIHFGRIAAQLAKQVLAQKIRVAERTRVADSYRERVNEIISGVVKRVTREFIAIDLGANAEALLMREEMLPREAMRVGDRIRAYLYEIAEQKRGPQILVSRTRPEMLTQLFSVEVPEIGEELIEIKGAARDPGVRAKIAVKTNDGRIDPVGACVGMRGARVQSVSNELGGERVDIVLWDDNPAQLVINALAPAEVVSIVADEESRTMDIAVTEEQLPQAIGRGGQNVRLASDLTKWTLNVMSETDFELKRTQETQSVADLFSQTLELDEDIVGVLVESGFSTLEEVAYVSESELLNIDGFDEEIVEELQRRAKDALLTQAIAQEQAPSVEPAADLLALDGMDETLANQLANQGIVTQEDLAEQAVDDLIELTEIDEKRAADLIMAARAPWFAEDDK